MATAQLSAWGSPASHVMGILPNGATVGSTALTTQYNGIGMTWQAAMADTITAIGYHQGTTTLTPGASYKAALFPLTTGGLPNTGATFANAALGSVTPTPFTPSSGNDNKWVWVDVSANPFTVTQGQEFAIVVWKDLLDATNSITVNGFIGTGFVVPALPAAVTCAAGTWTKPALTDWPVMAVKSSSAIYGRPWSTNAFNTNVAIGSTTEGGMVFTVPTNYCSTFVVRGIRANIKTPASSATNTFQANLYSSPLATPVQIAKSALVVNDRFEKFSADALLELYFTTNPLPVLTAGTQYGIGLSTTSASDGGNFVLSQVSQSDFNAWAYQQSTIFAARTASSFAGIDAGTATGNFATTVTQRPFMELLLDDLTAPLPGYSRSRTVFA